MIRVDGHLSYEDALQLVSGFIEIPNRHAPRQASAWDGPAAWDVRWGPPRSRHSDTTGDRPHVSLGFGHHATIEHCRRLGTMALSTSANEGEQGREKLKKSQRSGW